MVTVKKPAIKTRSGKVESGGKDHDAIEKRTGDKGKRGFLLSDGSFASREKAAKVANSHGQTERPVQHLKSHQLKKK